MPSSPQMRIALEKAEICIVDLFKELLTRAAYIERPTVIVPPFNSKMGDFNLGKPAAWLVVERVERRRWFTERSDEELSFGSSMQFKRRIWCVRNTLELGR